MVFVEWYVSSIVVLVLAMSWFMADSVLHQDVIAGETLSMFLFVFFFSLLPFVLRKFYMELSMVNLEGFSFFFLII